MTNLEKLRTGTDEEILHLMQRLDGCRCVLIRRTMTEFAI